MSYQHRGGMMMSEKEKEILENIARNIKAAPDTGKAFLDGVATGMAFAAGKREGEKESA